MNTTESAKKPPDGTKLARIRRCMRCPGNNWRAAADWKWPHCLAASSDKELSDAFMAAPASECPDPADYWKDLKPVDVLAELEIGRKYTVKRQVRHLTPVLRIAMAGLSQTEGEKRLAAMVREGFLEAEAAHEIADLIGWC